MSEIYLKAASFDLDGVIIDSEAMWQQCVIELYHTYGVCLVKEDLFQFAGASLRDIVAIFNEKLDINFSLTKVHKDLRELADSQIDHLEPIDSIGVALDTMRHLNFKIALCTSSTPDVCDKIIDKLKIREFFSAITTSAEVNFVKPHPEPYLLTLQKLQLYPSRVVAIEDSITGVLAAKSAQMPVLALPSKHLRDDKRYGIADMVLHSLSEITPSYIRDFSEKTKSIKL